MGTSGEGGKGRGGAEQLRGAAPHRSGFFEPEITATPESAKKQKDKWLGRATRTSDSDERLGRATRTSDLPPEKAQRARERASPGRLAMTPAAPLRLDPRSRFFAADGALYWSKKRLFTGQKLTSK